MKIESHKNVIKESLEVIKESINKGLLERQRTLGFHCSAVLIDILEIYLHKKNLIHPGTVIKHDFFSSERKALEKLDKNFDSKKEIIKLLVDLENRRNLLCYGKQQDLEFIEKYIELFNKIKKIFDNMGVDYE